MSINSYPTVFAIGHKMIVDLFTGPVLLEEKVDGSQFSFGLIDGELMCRSKGKQLILDAPEKMFAQAVEEVREMAPYLHPGWIYRCEYLQKPKHNTLAYKRVPNHHLIGFDIMTGTETYLSYTEKLAAFVRIGLETVPMLYEGEVTSLAMFNTFLERDSILGGCKIEGVVAKNYIQFTAEKKIAIGKYVSEAFKEVHSGEWRKANPTNGDITQSLIEQYRTEARWQKAVQHLRETGELAGDPTDIGKLMKEANIDIERECADEIKEKLFAHFWPKIRRGATAGLPEWYKQELAKGAFVEAK
jgi:hypothetical protein